MYVIKDGASQKIDDDSWPYWRDLGWAQDLNQDGEADPGGGSFPDFTGSGSPEGVVTADVGKFYVDTGGGIYVKVTGSGNTDWRQVGGVLIDPGTVLPGISMIGSASPLILAARPGGVTISDADAYENSGNGIYYKNNTTDGEQFILISLGPSGAHLTQFLADGTTEFPGNVTVNGTYKAVSGTVELDGDVYVDGGLTVAGGDIALAVGAGPVIHDDTDGHTYRIGSHNGAVTLTQVT